MLPCLFCLLLHSIQLVPFLFLFLSQPQSCHLCSPPSYSPSYFPSPYTLVPWASNPGAPARSAPDLQHLATSISIPPPHRNFRASLFPPPCSLDISYSPFLLAPTQRKPLAIKSFMCKRECYFSSSESVSFRVFQVLLYIYSIFSSAKFSFLIKKKAPNDFSVTMRITFIGIFLLLDKL